MGRNFSNKISKKALLQGIAVFFFSAVTTTLLFQNCSQVSVSDMTVTGKEEQARILRIGAGEVEVEVGASQYDKSEQQFDVNLKNVPKLRQMWILDNSNTMDANGLNLASSFGAMFDQNNVDSLYKFDTTAYLFSTAQAVPSFVTGTDADRAVLTDVVDRQAAFFTLIENPITLTKFDNELRTASQNSGIIPGDNVGVSIRRVAGTNDYSIVASPVLSKNVVGSNVVLTAAISKPANMNTTAFEADFVSKVGVLKSSRVPQYMVGSDRYRQSGGIVDKESGLCAVARILDNSDSMYTADDYLAFTIVSDENENNVSGTNCLKRTAKLQGEEVVSGRCSEYETTFSYTTTTTTTANSTCTLTGRKGYEGKFQYNIDKADVSYRAKLADAYTSYSAPRTRITYSTPKYRTKATQTVVSYNVQSCSAAGWKYRTMNTPVLYYEQNCYNDSSDGITKVICEISSTGKSGSLYGNVTQANCAAATLAAYPKAATTVRDSITTSYLPVCGSASWSGYTSTACTVAANKCEREAVPAACSITGTRQTKNLIGDHRGTNCNAGATILDSNAATVIRDSISAAHMPSCAPELVSNYVACDTANSLYCVLEQDGFKTDNISDVYGTIANGSNACINHASLPTNKSNPICAPLAAETGNGVCPAGRVDCVATAYPETTYTKTVLGKTGIKNSQDCIDWVLQQGDRRILSQATDISCSNYISTPNFVSSKITFALASDNGTTFGTDTTCTPATRTALWNALSTSEDRALLASDAACKITGYDPGSKDKIVLSATTCELQKDADCSANNFRNCLTTQIAGGTTYPTTPPVQHANKLNMQANCDTKCKDVFSGFCESTPLPLTATIRDYFTFKYGGAGKTIGCLPPSLRESAVIKPIEAQPVADRINFCPASSTTVPRYFIQVGPSYRTNTDIESFVTGTTTDSNGKKVPAKNLVTYIKDKIAADKLNVNFTVFVRRNSAETAGTSGTGIDYIGTHYLSLVEQTGGQAYAVTDTNYASALSNLSSVLKSKLLRSFIVQNMEPHQLITDVTIVRPSGSQKLAIGEWSQSVNTVTIANAIPFEEGNKVIIRFQNNDGYILAQLKKSFIIDEMRPDQIVLSVEHIKASGETVLLRTDQWLKKDNTVSIDPSIVIFGGDRFRIKFKNNTTEE